MTKKEQQKSDEKSDEKATKEQQKCDKNPTKKAMVKNVKKVMTTQQQHEEKVPFR